MQMLSSVYYKGKERRRKVLNYIYICIICVFVVVGVGVV